MRAPDARRPHAALLAVLFGALALLGMTAPAAAADAAPVASIAPVASTASVVPIAPADGATVDHDPRLSWTEVTAPGYEVRWNTDGTVGPDGALDLARGDRAFPTEPSYRLDGLTEPTYHWQVRALPAGAWSSVARFHVDLQLETLAPGREDARDEPLPAQQPAASEGARPAVGALLQGFLWIGGASTFAGILLAIVAREWLRLRREESR